MNTDHFFRRIGRAIGTKNHDKFWIGGIFGLDKIFDKFAKFIYF